MPVCAEKPEVSVAEAWKHDFHSAIAKKNADAMRRASAAHGEHEKRIGHADENWPDWYAAYMVAERAGTELPR